MVRNSASPFVSDGARLNSYLEDIRRLPMLAPQEEFALAKRRREHGDRGAGHKLINNRLRTHRQNRYDLPGLWFADFRHHLGRHRERRIFEARRFADEPIPLEELATEFGVSRERIRHIEVRAFQKVQKGVMGHIFAMEEPRRFPEPRLRPSTVSNFGPRMRTQRCAPHAAPYCAFQ
jgi:DNA-directed RNA polymerase sigma subunit (sigma70/sigma32)